MSENRVILMVIKDRAGKIKQMRLRIIIKENIEKVHKYNEVFLSKIVDEDNIFIFWNDNESEDKRLDDVLKKLHAEEADNSMTAMRLKLFWIKSSDVLYDFIKALNNDENDENEGSFKYDRMDERKENIKYENLIGLIFSKNNITDWIDLTPCEVSDKKDKNVILKYLQYYDILFTEDEIPRLIFDINKEEGKDILMSEMLGLIVDDVKEKKKTRKKK